LVGAGFNPAHTILI